MKSKRTKKCPHCKGTGRVKIDTSGLTKEENAELKKKWKDMNF